MHLIKFPNYHTAEIFQALDIKFAFVVKKNKTTYKQQHLAIKCRDFLGDCLWSKATKQPTSIYGFKYDFKESPYNSRRLVLSLTFPNKESKDNFINNFDSIKQKDIVAKVKTISSWEITDDDNTLLIFADKSWQSAQWKLSLYTFYLKVISYQTVEYLQSPEDRYAAVLTPEKEQILLSYINKNVNVIHETINMAHNYSGFVSLLKKQNKELYTKFPELEAV